MVMGGIGVKAKDRPIQSLYSKNELINTSTGEINLEASNQYVEEKSPRVMGLLYKSIEIITHWRQWKMISALEKSSEQLFESITENVNDSFLNDYQEFISFERGNYN
jgi:hypothetical protein